MRCRWSGILRVCAVGAMSTAVWTHPHAQSTFKAGISMVATYVTVIDDHGRLVTSLSESDFELLDNGRPQRIGVFQAGLLPITIVLLLDNSASMRASKPSTDAAGAAFLERLLPEDRATVGFFSRTVTITGDLTNDRDELKHRLELSLPVMAGTALWDAVNGAMATLADEPGRRVILVLTDGDDNTSEASATTIATRAVQDGLLIYAIGIRNAEGRLSKSLKELAVDSGGSFVELKPQDNLALAFRQVADELHKQYLIGFAPSVFDGKVHRLQVKVGRRGLRVRARNSYVASPPGVGTGSLSVSTRGGAQ